MGRIGLLVCDHVSPELRHVAGDYPDMFERLFGPRLELVPYDLLEGRFPASPDECDGWITTGSRYSVYEPVGWIEQLTGFVRDVVGVGTPYVGVCFGHQMLAQALGGKVERAATGWGLGIKEVEVAAPPGWLGTQTFRLLYSHADQVTDLPPGAESLGSSDHCAHSLIRVGDSAIGVQGHPEFEPDYVSALIDSRRGSLVPEDVCEAALASLEVPPDNRTVGEAIVRFFERRRS